MMMQIFEAGTGKFVPLDDDQLGMLNEAQVRAYNEVRDAVAASIEAAAEVESAKAENSANVSVLSEAERNAPPARTFMDEWKASTGKV
jgi:hypothetical protein